MGRECQMTTQQEKILKPKLGLEDGVADAIERFGL